MIRYSNSVVEVSEIGNLETEINRLYRELSAASNKAPDRFSYYVNLQETTPKDYMYSNILADRGDGRINSGIKSLDLLSIMCSGTIPQNLFLFDKVVYAGSVSAFKRANAEQLTQLVLQNLGMDTVLAALDNSLADEFRNKCHTIGKEVLTGCFEVERHKSYLVSTSKKLVKLYIREQNE